MSLPSGSSASPSSASRWEIRIFFLVCLLLALSQLTRSWNKPILDRHEFRQLQTGLSAYWMREEGLHLAYPLPLFGPPWSAPMEFPLYQACVALASRTFSLPLEQTGRAGSALFFLGTLPALYGLLGMCGMAADRRWLVLGACLVTPIYLFYSRAVMIESTALCLAVWFLLIYLRAVNSGGWGWTAGAATLGALAAVVKVTTFAVFCAPAAGFALATLWRRWSWWRAAGAALPLLVAFGGGWWWVHFSDGVKGANPFSLFLVSARMNAWNFGPLGQRFNPAFWQGIYAQINLCALAETSLALLLVLFFFVDARHRRGALLSVAAFFTGPLLFSNLYLVHDYYLYANALFLAGAAGWLLAGTMDSVRLPRAARIAVLAVFFGAQVLAYVRGYGDYHVRTLPSPPALAAVIRAVVPADDAVLIHGWDWNSLLPYYAQRRAVMMPLGHENDFDGLARILDRLPPRRIAAVVWKGEGSPPAHLMRWWQEHLDLVNAPIAESPDGNLYLPGSSLATAAHTLRGKTFDGVRINFAPPADPLAAKLREQVFGDDELAGLATPAPLRGRSLFGIGVGDLDGRRVIFANALSELYFLPPAGAGRIAAGFGLDPKSYLRPDKTDGIDVEIIEELPAGLRRVLYRRSLRPATEPNDRAVQTIELDGIGPITGTLVFRLSPGPAGNTSYDWSFWTHIRIQ